VEDDAPVVTVAIPDLRLDDLVAFLTIARSASMSAAARELRVTPSKLSKVVARLERQFGRSLLSRTAQGVRLNQEGHAFATEVHTIVTRLHTLQRSPLPEAPPMGVGAPSYLLAAALPAFADLVTTSRFRGVELPPSLLRSAFGERLFDIAILPGGCPKLPPSWAESAVGDITKGLFARRDIAARLGRGPVDPERLLAHRFVTPSYYANGGFVAVSDECPIPLERRRTGNEVASFALALDVAVATGELVFGPRLAARGHLQRGDLVEIPVAGWDIRESLHLCCETNRVSKRLRDAMASTLATLLDESATPMDALAESGQHAVS
jgi:DNA-binding transcriptional LysR family regulator